MADSSSSMDWQTIVNRVLAYTIEGLVLALAAYFIPAKGNMKVNEIITIALVGAATFALLDLYMPNSTVAQSARSGAGYGIGLNLVGFPRM
jgi:hypothetical protein